MLIASECKFILMIGTKFRYGSARLQASACGGWSPLRSGGIGQPVCTCAWGPLPCRDATKDRAVATVDALSLPFATWQEGLLALAAALQEPGVEPLRRLRDQTMK